jgi:hypothetical protein
MGTKKGKGTPYALEAPLPVIVSVVGFYFIGAVP